MTPQTELNGGVPGGRSAPAISPEDIRRQLERMLASRTFQAAEGQKAFLRYAVGEVIAGRASLIKEYLIGVEAFSRGESFDPRMDPIVRTQARKLRARLLKYYETEGREDPIKIDFPKGSYVPAFSRAEDTTAAIETPVPRDVSSESAKIDEPIAFDKARIPAFALRSKWVIAVSSAALLAALLATRAYYVSQHNSGERVLAAGSSIAVLPFVNLNGDSANEFLSDGLTDDLIESLGQIPGLRVVARTSAFRFKGKAAANAREVGQQLNVHAVLRGTVNISGNTLRITAQLMNVADGHHLWSGRFDHALNDAGSIQKEISTEVASVLGARFQHDGEEPGKKISGKPISPNHEAYEAYLKGLYLWNKLSTDGLQMAIQSFEKAIAADPSFARGYSALADSYVMAPQVSTAAQMEIIPKIRAAANKALTLDSSLGEAHIDLAICAEYDFDWATAENEFKKGLNLSPDNVVGHIWYAKFLAIVGRREEVLTQRKIAAELDPVSPYALQAVGGYLSIVGRYDEAIEQFRSAIALEPNFGLSHQGLGVAYALHGRPAEAIAELQTASKLMPGPRREALLGWAYGASGNLMEGKKILQGFLSQSSNPSFPALAIAQVYIGLGEKDEAFKWLQRAADQRDLDLTLKWDSFYEPLRTDPRYRALLRRMNLS